MEFKYHVLVGILIPAFLHFLLDVQLIVAITIALASILIDIDHYFWYVVEAKDANPLNAIKWYVKASPKIKKMPHKKRQEYTRGVFIFHNWICWGLLFLLGFLNPFFFYILIGFMIHIIPDLVVLRRMGESIIQKISIGYVLKRNKKKKLLVSI